MGLAFRTNLVAFGFDDADRNFLPVRHIDSRRNSVLRVSQLVGLHPFVDENED